MFVCSVTPQVDPINKQSIIHQPAVTVSPQIDPQVRGLLLALGVWANAAYRCRGGVVSFYGYMVTLQLFTNGNIYYPGYSRLDVCNKRSGNENSALIMCSFCVMREIG